MGGEVRKEKGKGNEKGKERNGKIKGKGWPSISPAEVPAGCGSSSFLQHLPRCWPGL